MRCRYNQNYIQCQCQLIRTCCLSVRFIVGDTASIFFSSRCCLCHHREPIDGPCYRHACKFTFVCPKLFCSHALFSTICTLSPPLPSHPLPFPPLPSPLLPSPSIPASFQESGSAPLLSPCMSILSIVLYLGRSDPVPEWVSVCVSPLISVCPYVGLFVCVSFITVFNLHKLLYLIIHPWSCHLCKVSLEIEAIEQLFGQIVCLKFFNLVRRSYS